MIPLFLPFLRTFRRAEKFFEEICDWALTSGQRFGILAKLSLRGASPGGRELEYGPDDLKRT